MDVFAVDISAARHRQQRLLDVMSQQQLDLVILAHRENVQWLTGAYFSYHFQPAAAIRADGFVTLVAPQKPPCEAAVDDLLRYEAQSHSTLRNDQRQLCTDVLVTALKANTPPQRVGVEFSSCGMMIHKTLGTGTAIDLEPDIYHLRRHKDAAELARIKKAISATEKMYERARALIEPGITEIEVFNALQAAAVEECGEMLTGTGNDYQCGSRGGPPRNHRPAEAGELYILDLGPAFRGYFADNARTIAVTTPTAQQQQAWECIQKVFDHVETHVRPGKNAQELFHEVQGLLDQAPLGQFNHHLGHGIGLFPHEAPHLNPHWNDTFETGDVFTAEPGLYAPELRAGMRIENNYLVTEDGVECLTQFPRDL